MTYVMQGPATEKQAAFIRRLAGERGMAIPSPESMSKAEASAMITRLLNMPVAPKAGPAPQPLAEGMYRDSEGNIFKVQRSGSGNMYAKALVPIGGQRLTETEDVVQFEFVYSQGAIRHLSAANRMTLDEAKAFGIVYGVCCVCGTKLSDAKSVAAGIGPVCAKRV